MAVRLTLLDGITLLLNECVYRTHKRWCELNSGGSCTAVNRNEFLVEMRNDIELKANGDDETSRAQQIITESNRMASIEFQNVNMQRRTVNGNVRKMFNRLSV